MAKPFRREPNALPWQRGVRVGAAVPVLILSFALQLTAQERREDTAIQRLRELQLQEHRLRQLQQVAQPPLLRLIARPESVVQGEEVTFTVEPTGREPGVRVERADYQRRMEALRRAEVQLRAANPRSLVYQFHFGDGQMEPVAEGKVGHVYEQTGSFRAFVFVRAEDEEIAVASSDTVVITVRPRQERVRLRAEPQNAAVGQRVWFILEPPDSRYPLILDPGDGSGGFPVQEPRVDYIYRAPGEYLARLIEQRPTGARRLSDSTMVLIHPVGEVVGRYSVSLDADDRTPEPGQPVHLEGRLEPPDVDARFQFELGDGHWSEWLDAPVLDHAYGAPTTYQVTLRARVDDRIVDAATLVLNVQSARPAQAPAPRVVLVPDRRNLEPGELVRFRAEVQPPAALLEYRFDFGNAIRTVWQSESEAEYRYNASGSYSAFVQVRNAAGATGQSEAVIVRVDPGPALGWKEILGGVCALALLTGLTLAMRSRPGNAKEPSHPKPGTRLTIEAHTGEGSGELDRGREELVRAQLRLRPVLDRGRQIIESERPIMKREWTVASGLEDK